MIMTMKQLKLEKSPFHQISYLNACRSRRGAVKTRLPLFFGTARGLPADIEGLVVTSDLQGVAPVERYKPKVLLGIQLVNELKVLSETGRIPALDRLGVALAGDLYSAPGGDVRGASGDVRSVLETFAKHFAWVISVAGNHDRYGTPQQKHELSKMANLLMLDGSLSSKGKCLFGGVSYAMGHRDKEGWVKEEDFLTMLELILEQDPDVLMLHHGPQVSDTQPGSIQIRKVIQARPPPLVICGHYHWEQPTANIGVTQVLNVDARVVILKPPR